MKNTDSAVIRGHSCLGSLPVNSLDDIRDGFKLAGLFFEIYSISELLSKKKISLITSNLTSYLEKWRWSLYLWESNEVTRMCWKLSKAIKTCILLFLLIKLSRISSVMFIRVYTVIHPSPMSQRNDEYMCFLVPKLLSSCTSPLGLQQWLKTIFSPVRDPMLVNTT